MHQKPKSFLEVNPDSYYKLSQLKIEQRDIDFIIERERQKPVPDNLLIKRYQKRRLQTKEQILKIEMEKVKFDLANRFL